jgi:chorismate--pyruvate lyase
MLSTLLSEAPVWQTQRHPFARTLSVEWQSWLFDRGSLTQRLIELSHGHFRVAVLREDWRAPMPWERDALNLPARHIALVREVALLCNEKPLVYARSVLPATTLIDENRHLKMLGTKPLGAALFNSPSLKREPIVVAAITHLKTTPYITKQNPAYARCSVFYLANKPLLVSEIFLPEIITYTAPHDQ